MSFQGFEIKVNARGHKSSERLPALRRSGVGEYQIKTSGEVWGKVMREGGFYGVYDAGGEFVARLQRKGRVLRTLPQDIASLIAGGQLVRPAVALDRVRREKLSRRLVSGFAEIVGDDPDGVYAALEKAQAALPPINPITRLLNAV